MKNLAVALIFSAAVLVAAAPVPAQAPAAGGLPTKVAVIDFRAAITSTAEGRARLQRQYQRLQQQLQRKQEEFQQDLNDAQEDAFKRMGAKMQEVVTRYARENGYAVVMDPSQAGVIYFSTQLDVTQDLIHLYDQAYPVKASASAPEARPAGTPAQRPAQPPASTAPAKPKP